MIKAKLTNGSPDAEELRSWLMPLALALGVMGLAVSWSVFNMVVNGHEARLANDFRLDVNRQLAKLDQGLRRTSEQLRSVSAFFLSSDSVGASEFRNFTATYLRQEAGLSMLAWAPMEMIDDPGLEEAVDEESLIAGISLPLEHIEPGPRDELAFGKDLLNVPGMKAAVENSFQSGNVQSVITGERIILITPTLDFIDWSGVAIAVLPTDSLAAWINLGEWDAKVSIVEERSSRIILENGAPPEGASAFVSSLSLAGEIWRVTAWPGEVVRVPAGAWGTLAAGVVITGLVLLLLVTLANSAEHAAREVRVRTRELQQAEQEARNQAVRLADEVSHTGQVLSAIPSILIGLDLDSRINQWNSAAREISGISAADAVGRPIGDCGWSGDVEILSDGVARCLSDREVVRLDELCFERPDSEQATLGVAIVPVHNSEKVQIGCLLIGADVTEKNMMEIQLREAQRLEAVGRLAAGIAHEVNTPSQFVSDNTTFLQEAFTDLIELEAVYNEICSAPGLLSDEQKQRIEAAREAADRDFLLEEVPQALAQSLDGIRRIADIVRAMKEFSHPGGGGHKEQADLNRLINNAITVAANEWKYHAEVETEFDENLPPVPCFPRELNQVVLNLLINGAHAIADRLGDSGERGKIRITTALRDNAVEMRVSDSGTGIPEHIRNNVFEPFFTTKEVGRGSGQGLALAYSAVVEQHGGELSFETETDVGTTFIVSLPLKSQKTEEEVTA
ncbi:MAG: PAS domain-containing protein [Gammaproteobacteria bacterium]|nr:PAS domain-containing protein [Gammaproteobacteria bacterium]NNM19876.1 PAS domain-containing protein [Gammaproteobacteria bacterium]